MATFEVTQETITVRLHPNADRLELATVGLYNVVVAKDEHKTGDTVLYIPEYAVLPDDLIEKMGLTGKLAGSKHNRVTPIKLRGELSQGLVMPLRMLAQGAPDVRDYAPFLGIEKWQPEVPAAMGGDVEANAELVPWIDVENIKKFPDMFTAGEPVTVTEKAHGTSSAFTFLNPLTEDTAPIVTSKGLGEKRLSLKEDERNVYWRMLHEYNLDAFARAIATSLVDSFSDEDTSVFIEKVALFGETYGSKIQDLHYGRTNGNLGFALFDIYVEYTVTNHTIKAWENIERWLDPAEVTRLSTEHNVPQVPVLFEGPFDLDTVIALASGPEQISGKELHIREGVVVRPARREAGYSAGAERIGKYVSDAYLTRKGGSEYA